VGDQPNWYKGYVPPAEEWNDWWSRKLDATDPVLTNGPWMPLSGGSMRGPLILSGDPVDFLQATTKEYVDALNTSAVQRYGDFMLGDLSLARDPVDGMQAATKQYVDRMLPLAGGVLSGPLFLSGDPTDAFGAATKRYVDNYPYLLRAGGVMTGLLTLSGDPTSPLQAATRRYVDSVASI